MAIAIDVAAGGDWLPGRGRRSASDHSVRNDECGRCTWCIMGSGAVAKVVIGRDVVDALLP